MQQLLRLLFLSLAFPYGEGLARFFEEDARQVDHEFSLSTETFNDKLSYRYPLSFQKKWQDKNGGFRMSSGSLNASRLNYHEEAIFETKEPTNLYLGYHREVKEDFIDLERTSYLKIGYQENGHRAGIMGEGGTFKEYGDLGAFWSHTSKKYDLSMYYWSVDHYYNEKRQRKEDKIERSSYTLGLKSALYITEDLSLSFYLSYDHPLRWKRYSEGYIYDYQYQHLFYRLDYKNFYIDTKYTAKREGKKWLINNDPQAEKSMQRRTFILEIGHASLQNGVYETMGVELISRDADYKLEQKIEDIKSITWEEFSFAKSKRREMGAFYTKSSKTDISSVSLQLGGYVSLVRIEEEKTYKEVEVKLQYGILYQLSENSMLFFNTTWDIDQLIKDFPYQKDPFRPWGGGNIGAQLTL